MIPSSWRTHTVLIDHVSFSNEARFYVSLLCLVQLENPVVWDSESFSVWAQFVLCNHLQSQQVF